MSKGQNPSLGSVRITTTAVVSSKARQSGHYLSHSIKRGQKKASLGHFSKACRPLEKNITIIPLKLWVRYVCSSETRISRTAASNLQRFPCSVVPLLTASLTYLELGGLPEALLEQLSSSNSPSTTVYLPVGQLL